MPNSVQPLPQAPQKEEGLGEIGKREGDYFTGINTAAQAVGLGNLREILRDANQRVRDSHRMMARAAGLEDSVGKDAEMPGDIIITGDITQPPPQPAAPAQPATAAPSLASKLLPWLLAAGLGAGAGGLAVSALKQPAGPTNTTTSTSSKEGFLIELVPPKDK